MTTPAVPTAEEAITYSSGRTGPPDLRFLHYNDVYHIDASSRDPVGGIARFQTVCNDYRSGATFVGQPDLITLFSGDAYNPSLESTVTKGSHMVPVLNGLRTDCACVGNHDLDFGVPQFERLAAKCKFPWLLANVLDPALGEDVSLGNAHKTVILPVSNGLKVGIIGLVEREWLDTINSLPPDLQYLSASATAKKLVPNLRRQGADIIVAVTHAREPNDIKLASKTPPGLIDIILGGHDHFYGHSIVNGTHILRSGTDFKNLSYIKAWKKVPASQADQGQQGWDFDIIRRDIVRSIPEDAEAKALVDKISSGLRSRLEKPVGWSDVPLDSRFTTVRMKESNLGNFVCDLMRLYYQADCTIMASGTFRGDQVYPAGVIRAKDIMDCFPFEDPVVVLRVTGRAILDALENSVCLYPALEGRFPQVSNICFTFDASLPPHKRVTKTLVGGKPIDPVRKYVLATRDYMARGKDGFKSLMPVALGGEAEEVVSEENGMLISMLLRQYFMSMRMVGLWAAKSPQSEKIGTLHDSGVHSKQGAKNKHANLMERRKDSLVGYFEQKVCSGLQSPDSLSKNTADHSSSHSTSDSNYASDSDSNTDLEEHEAATNNSPISPRTIPGTPTTPRLTSHDRAQYLRRRFAHKWWRLAGLDAKKGTPSCASGGSGDGVVIGGGTTGMPKGMKPIAPKVEGRIIVVGAITTGT